MTPGKLSGLLASFWVAIASAAPLNFDLQDFSVKRAGFGGGRFLVPNEAHFHLFDASLRGKTGVLISIGTFRAFEAASRGLFSHALILDVDPNVVRFNDLQIDVLKRSKTRIEFILQLYGLPTDLEAKAEIREAFKQGHFFKLSKLLNSMSYDAPYPIDPDAQHELSQRHQYLETVLRWCDSGRLASVGFLADETRYQRLRQLALVGHLYSLNIDVVGANFEKIARRLREDGLQVDVLDLSNAADYFLQRHGRKPEELEQFGINLRTLPFGPDAFVNMTTTYIHEPQDPPDYLSLPAKLYADGITSLPLLGSFQTLLRLPSSRKWILKERTQRCVSAYF